jgi:sugar phosphate isomerase/epimerase
LSDFHSLIKPGIVHYAAFPAVFSGRGPVAETLKVIARDAFFRAVEIAWVQDPDERLRVGRIVEVSGLEVTYSALPAMMTHNLDISSLDEGERRKSVEALVPYMDQAKQIGAIGFAVLSGPDANPESRGRAKCALARSLAELCEAGGPRGLEVLMEVFDRSLQRKKLIGPAGDAADVARTVVKDHKNFGLVVDHGHIPLLGETPLQALTPVAPYLGRVHIGNCVVEDRSHPRWGDSHPRIGIPGGANGVCECAHFLETCVQVGYLRHGKPRVVGLEVKPDETEDPELVIAASKRALLEAWSLMAA